MEPDVADLLILGTLDLLTPEEAAFLQAQVAADPDQAAALAADQHQFAQLGYGVDSLEPAPDLKHRLGHRLGLADWAPTLAVVRATDRVWQTLGRPGVEIAYLYRDETRREMTCLLRLAPGASLPHHRHADWEEIFMLEGDLECDGQVFQAGDYLRAAPDTDHIPSSRQGCVAYVRTSLDNEFLPGLAVHGNPRFSGQQTC